MKLIILILVLLSRVINSNDDYQISFDLFLTGEKKIDLKLFNKRQDEEVKFYSGTFEDIDDALTFNKTGRIVLKEGKHPLVYVSKGADLEYINLFPITTIFVMSKNHAENLKNESKINYNIYTINSKEYEFNYYSNFYLEQNFYYIKIGKKLDKTMEGTVNILIFFNTTVCLLISVIIRKIIKSLEPENLLPIYFLICSISDLLLITNITNGISFLFFKDSDYYFIAEYMTLFTYSFFKSVFYSIMIYVLLGWMTINFFGWGGNTFKKISKRIIFYDLVLSIIILISIYFTSFASKLNLFYLKNLTEHIPLLSFILYCIFKKLIPLSKQMIYEQQIRSDLVKCIRFKFKRLFFSNLIMLIYALVFLSSPTWEYKFIYNYIENFNIHLVFQLFYETIFMLCFCIIFSPRKLPEFYFDEIVFNYKGKVFLVADVSEKNDADKLNLSNLNYNKLKKISKKDNYPLLLLNPFSSAIDNIFNEVHIGSIHYGE
jgi:hypothetical protein